MPTARNQYLWTDPTFNIEVWIKRLDELHPDNIGNKLFKLKYNFKEAARHHRTTILTFGGAYSNHIAAVAAEGKRCGFKTIGVIRGEELGADLERTLTENPTLKKARSNGMIFEFISRQRYRQKETIEFKAALLEKYGDIQILPEGGTNALAVKGCAEILSPEDDKFDFICAPVGTGGTLAGMINAANQRQQIMGFSALNTDLTETIRPFVYRTNWQVFRESDFGGFAKINSELVSFINEFQKEYAVVLDPIYTGKMMYALKKKIDSGQISKNKCILAIHTGGLQGIHGMNRRLEKQGLPLINYNTLWTQN